ncbi:hypothetical protein Z945_2582 [Sulfitobacter noctilucae]|uniref:hypothetical protein n=1 Tax=Sulfitobacter noctilucae TaxID=1342302 RepID=UPI0004680B01|nr:hypothetical protein [Sulfitobacter noctilucae]KIN61589.1 hypothetical protein Z945_2582 [Sulfitobacter noctilucae]
MAKKPSPAELKKEGEELGKKFAEMRKTQHNFAMQIGKEGLAFQADKRKPPEALWRIAKKEGGSSKGAMGTCMMSGKIIELDCVDPDNVPTNLAKLAKTYFKDRGQPARIVIKGQPDEEADEEGTTEEAGAEAGGAAGGGDTAGGDTAGAAPQAEEAVPEEEAAKGAAPEPEKTLLEQLEDMKPDIEACMASGNAGLAKKVGGLNTMFDAVVEKNPKKAVAIFGLLKTTLDTAREKGDFVVAVPGGEVESGGSVGGDGMSEGAPAGDDPKVLERRSKIADLERGVDELLAEFA